MNGAEIVTKVLQEQGVNTLFGYPGGAIMPIYDAIYQSPLQHYLCRHEQGAGFAAIGYARSSGKTGVCMATSGPGATNLITALADAMMDSVPVVAITGQVSQAAMGSDAFQEVDVLGLSLAVTKYSVLVSHVSELENALNEAFRQAKSGRCGPVLVDIPKNIQQQELSQEEWAQFRKAQATPTTSHPQSADEDNLALARKLIAQAQRPVAYVGGGVHMANAVEQLQAFLHNTQIPSVCTLKALGSVAGDSPNYLGMLGMHGNQAANLAVQNCDLLICLGARFDDRVTGKLDTFAANAKVIQLDIDAAEVNKLRKPDCALLGDMATLLKSIACPVECSDWQQQCQQLKAQHSWRYDHPGERIYAPSLLKQLSEGLSDNAVVCCDVGQHQMWVAQHMQFSSPRNHLTSGGLGTMGFGLPAAIGARLARPQDPVVLVSGDGSFMMNVQELATIKRFQLDVKIVLIDNQRLGMVKQWQQLFFQQRYSETDLSDNPSFTTLAAAFDIPAACISEKHQVTDALDTLLNTPGPFLLHVCIDEQENVWPLVPPGAANHDMMTETRP